MAEKNKEVFDVKSELIFAGIDFSQRIRRYAKANCLELSEYKSEKDPFYYYNSNKRGLLNWNYLYGNDWRHFCCGIEKDNEDFKINDCTFNYGIDNNAMENILEVWHNCNVFYMSGHHYGDDFDHKYHLPGYASSCKSHTFQDDKSQKLFGSMDLFLMKLTKPYINIRMVLLMGCNYLRENMLEFYQTVFPNAVILAYHFRAPAGTKDDDLLFDFMERLDWSIIKKKVESTSEENESIKKKIVSTWIESIKASKRLRPQPGYYFCDHGTWRGEYFYSRKGLIKSASLGEPHIKEPRKLISFLYSGIDSTIIYDGDLKDITKDFVNKEFFIDKSRIERYRKV